VGSILIGIDELLRCHIPNGAVRPLLIIFLPSDSDHELRSLERHKPVLIEAFIAKLAIETLDKRVLRGFPWLNEVEVDAMLSCPRIQGRPGEFGPIIQDQSLWQWARQKHPIENPAHPCPPIELSTSITGASSEQGSVIVKHLNRQPVTNRSCTKPIVYSSSGLVGRDNATRETATGFLAAPL